MLFCGTALRMEDADLLENESGSSSQLCRPASYLVEGHCEHALQRPVKVHAGLSFWHWHEIKHDSELHEARRTVLIYPTSGRFDSSAMLYREREV